MADTNIAWADKVWNPIVGCSKVSEGCAHCYAEVMAKRLKAMGQPEYQDVVDDKGHWTGRVTLLPNRLDQPFRWHKPQRIFVNSMSDLFHPDVPFAFVNDILARMHYAHQHTYMVLTKRPERMLEYFRYRTEHRTDHIFPHLWLGVTAENQEQADKRIPLLLQVPAAVRFVSVEPMLGPVDLGLNIATCTCCDRWLSRWVRLNQTVRPDMPLYPKEANPEDHIAKAGIYKAESNRHGALSVITPSGLLGIKPGEFDCLPGLDWVICGGESGPNARPMHPDWARSLRVQCQAAGVPLFFKQWGEWHPVIFDTGEGDIGILPSGQLDPDVKPKAEYRFPDGTYVERIGKKAAGDLLDGQEWRQFPEAR